MAVSMTQNKASGGYSFTDANGNPISALTYSQMTGTPFYDLLMHMASTGDTGAGSFLQQYGNTPGGLAQDQAQVNAFQPNQFSGGVGGALTWATPLTQPSGGGGGGGGGGGTTVDPSVLAFFGGQIDNVQKALGNLKGQQDTGIQNILDQAQEATNKENAAYSKGTRDYNTNRQNTINDMLTAKQNIDTGVRQNTNAVQRLLGLAGSGSSSASQILAPYATSRVGNIQRQGVQTTYGRNLGSLDTSYGDFSTSHNNALGDITAQATNQQNAVKSGIEGTRQSLLNQLASITSQRDRAQGKTLTQAQSDIQPYIDQINQSLSQIPALQRLAINFTRPTAYAAPDLGQYNYDNTGRISGTGVNQGLPYADQISPYVVNPQQDHNKQKSVLLA